MTVGSLFAGIGGFDLAASRVWGWDCVRWQVEIDDFCRRVLAKHWPEVPRFGDIRELTGDELEPVDLVCGGFPCQPVSLAGKRAAQSDARWLWPEFRRIVSERKPRYVVIENVTGLLSPVTDEGGEPVSAAPIEEVLSDLATLGFDAEWDVLSACAAGAPHPRDRVFIVAHPAGFGRNGRRVRQQASTALEASRCSTAPDRPWAVSSAPVGVAYGLPRRVDRLRGLGNAIVPQVAEQLFRWIAEAEATP